MLERVRTDHGPRANIISADLTRSGGVAGFFAKETYQVTVEIPTSPSRAPLATAEDPVELDDVLAPPPARRAAVAPRDFAAVLGDLIDDGGESIDAAEMAERRELLRAIHDMPTSDPATRDPQPRHRQGAEPELPFAAREAAPRVVSMAESTDAGPVALGDLLGQIERYRLNAPALPGAGVVAVVGSRGDAIEVAVSLAQSIGRAASEVMLAAPGDASVTPALMAGIVEASMRRRIDRGLTGPVFVAVAVTPGIEGHRFAADVLERLRPSQTRLAVAGWRPLDRIAQTMAGLGGPDGGGIDTLDLLEAQGAPTPEAFLRLGVPVATIDGEPATTAMWAAILLDSGRAASLAELGMLAVTDPGVTSGAPADR